MAQTQPLGDEITWRRLQVVAKRTAGAESFRPWALYSGTVRDDLVGGATNGASTGVIIAVLVAGLALVSDRLSWLDGLRLTGVTDVVLAPLNWLLAWVLRSWHGLFAPLGADVSWVLSILALVLTIRVVLSPLIVARLRSQRAAVALRPAVQALQRQHRDDPVALRAELAKLYASRRVNALPGCLLLIVQVPIFVSAYHVLLRLDTLHDGGQDAAAARLLGVPLGDTFASADGLRARLVIGLGIVAWLVLIHANSRSSLSRSPSAGDQEELAWWAQYGLPTVVLTISTALPLAVVGYAVAHVGITLLLQLLALPRTPAPAGWRSARYGVSFLLVAAAAVLVGVALGASQPATTLGLAAAVGVAGTALLWALREWVATWSGGLGPLRAKGFLDSAVRNGLLSRDQGSYRFRAPV